MGFRVVVVDDHPIIRDGMRMLIEREADMAVVGDAADGPSACAMIEREKPDLVVLDVTMSGEGGLEVIRWMRACGMTARVLLLTGDVGSPLAQACVLAGADGVITKNTPPAELVKAVRTVAGGGTYLSPDATHAVVSAIHTQINGGGEGANLTPQEKQVLRGIAEGLSFKEIAARMGLSVKTVETYRARLVRKTGHRSKVALARFATERGLDKAI
jgi:DNA-binding NarL/FixJ family response regulator